MYVKFSHVFIRYKDTHYKISFVLSLLLLIYFLNIISLYTTQKYGSASVNRNEVLSEYRKQTQPFWIDFHCLTRCKMLDGMQPILLDSINHANSVVFFLQIFFLLFSSTTSFRKDRWRNANSGTIRKKRSFTEPETTSSCIYFRDIRWVSHSICTCSLIACEQRACSQASSLTLSSSVSSSPLCAYFMVSLISWRCSGIPISHYKKTLT